MALPDIAIAALAAFLVSAILCTMIVHATRRWPEKLTPRADLLAVQAAHKRPAARLGGVAILLGLAIGGMVLPASDSVRVLGLLGLSLIPVVLAGLAEDLGWMVSPRRRLAAAALSALFALLLFRVWVWRIDLGPVDILFGIAALAIPITLIWSSAVCHAFNLIDGVNGLSSGVAALAALGLGALALLAGQDSIAAIAWLLAAAILGFMVFNWPLGKVFLGDTGAYALGHVLTWLSILLLVRAPDLSVAALLGLFFWPVADTSLAIYRRWRAGRRLDQPDRLHFHQLVMRGLEIGFVGRGRRHVSNPLTTALILPLVALGIIGHIALWQMPMAGYLLLVIQVLLFFLIYGLGMRAFSQPRKRKLSGFGDDFTPRVMKRAG